MKSVMETFTLQQYVTACNGNADNALVLIDILDEGWNVPADHFYPLWFEEIETNTKVDQAQYLKCFEKIKSRFGIDYKASRSDEDFEIMALFAFDRDLVIALIDLYANA